MRARLPALAAVLVSALSLAACGGGAGGAGGAGGQDNGSQGPVVPQAVAFQASPLSDSCPHAVRLSVQFGKQFAGRTLEVKMSGPGIPADWKMKIPADGEPIVQTWPVTLPGQWRVVSMSVNGQQAILGPGLQAQVAQGSCWIPTKLFWDLSPGPCPHTLKLTIQWDSKAPAGVPFVLTFSGPGIPESFAGHIPADGSAIVQTYPVAGTGSWTITGLSENGEPARQESLTSTVSGC